MKEDSMLRGWRFSFAREAFQPGLLGVLLAVFWIAVTGPQPLGAQGLPGSISGIVSDQSDAVIPGSEIILVQNETNATRRTVTNAEGFFSILALPAGTYTLSVRREGFATLEQRNLVVQAGDRLTIPNLKMSLATVAEQVEVIAEGLAMVPLETGEKSHAITSREIDNLAVLGRSASELLKILPGVVYTNPDDAGGPAGFVVQFNRGIGDYNVAGTRNTQVASISDGANVIDPGCNCGSAVTPNVDMVQEVKVQTSNFAAENSLGPVVFSSVSKAGTNEFHGSAYTYIRHHKLNARDWRNNFFDTEKPTDSFYFPGFNIGGPIKRDKLFFFAGIEIQRQNRDLGVRPAVVPSEDMKRGDFSNTAYINALNGADVNQLPANDAEGNSNWSGSPITPGMVSNGRILPGAIDPGGQILINSYPNPNQDPAKSAGYNYTSNIINPEHRHQKLARVDYNISDNTKLYTRFNHEYQQSPYPFTLWWNNSNDVPWPGDLQGDYTTWSSSTSLVNVIDPSTTNEFVFGATYWNMNHEVRNVDGISRKALGYPYRGLYKNPNDVLPSMTGWGGGVADFIQPGGLLDPTIIGNKWLISLRDNFSKVAGTHTMKFGLFYEFVTNDEPTTGNDHGQMEFASWGGNSTNNAYADMLMGRLANYQEATTNLTGLFRKHEFSFFVQDSWKVSRRLTMEYGSRFQHQGWMFEKNGYQFGFDPRLYDPNSGINDLSGLLSPHLGHDVPRSIWKTPALVVAPRLGFAFDLTGRGRTVIRGGAGVFKYADRNGDVLGSIANPPLSRSTVVNLAGGVELYQIDAVDPATQIQKSSLRVLEPFSDRVPTTYNWSFTISHRLPTQTTLEASYVGNSSSHQTVCTNCGANLNAVPEGAMFGVPQGTSADDFRPFPNYGEINMIRHALSQNYNSLQVTANRQTGRFNYSLAYTFSKALGVGGNSFGTPSDSFDHKGRSYGLLPYDRTHGLSLAYNFEIPGTYTNPAAKSVLQGWQLTGITQFQSGAPLGSEPGRNFNFSGTMANGQDISPILTNGTPDTDARPHLICDPRDGLGANQYANGACFVAPSPGSNGTYQLPYVKTPGFQNHDLSLFKNFDFNEDKRLQLRFSAFNFLNRPLPFFEGGDPGLALNFVNGVPDAASLQRFGKTTLKRGRRLMQIAVKFYF
jgi:hypothetical protein